MEPRKPVLSPTPSRAYPTAVKTARVPNVTSDGAASRSQAGAGGVVLPMINPPSSSGIAPSSGRTNSPGGVGGKRTGWTTPRHPSDLAPAPGPPPARPPGRNARILDNGGEFQESSSPSSVGNISFWNDGAPAATSSSTDDTDQDKLAYMDSMYSRIQQLNTELDRDQEVRIQNIEHHVEQRERASLEAMQRYGSNAVEDSENFGLVGAQVPLQSAHETNAATVNRKFRPHQPRSTSPPQPAAILPQEQLELCAALGKNAELRIRAREIERQAEEASTVIEQSQRQMKMAERRIANREEKLRALLKEKLHWQSEMKDLREQVVEEKMRQVDLMRRLETNKRETTAQLDHMAQNLRDTEEDNQALRAYLIETKSHLAMQTKRFEEFVKQAREEKEKLTECIVEARGKFREWKEGEANALKAERDQALNYLRAEYELKIARHQDEKQKLRDKVKDLEVSVRLMQKDRSLSPLELSLRKATILGSKDHASTTEAELIEAHVRTKELEALLEHSQDFQRRQESIIKVSEATISRLIQEREIAALDTLANQQVAGSQAWGTSGLNADLGPLSLNSFSSSASAMSLSPGKLASPTRPSYSSSSARSLIQSPSHRMDPSPPLGRPKMPDQPFRRVPPSPRAHTVLSPSRKNSRDRLKKDESDISSVPPTANDAPSHEKIGAKDVNREESRASFNESVGENFSEQAADRAGVRPDGELRRAENKEAENDSVILRDEAKDDHVDAPSDQINESETWAREVGATVVPRDAREEEGGDRFGLQNEPNSASSSEQRCDSKPTDCGKEDDLSPAGSRDGEKEFECSPEGDTMTSMESSNEEQDHAIEILSPSSSGHNCEPVKGSSTISSDQDNGEHDVEVVDDSTAMEQATEIGDELPLSLPVTKHACDLSDVAPDESVEAGSASELAYAHHSSDERAGVQADSEQTKAPCADHQSTNVGVDDAVAGGCEVQEAVVCDTSEPEQDVSSMQEGRMNNESDEGGPEGLTPDDITEDDTESSGAVAYAAAVDIPSTMIEGTDRLGDHEDAEDSKSENHLPAMRDHASRDEENASTEDRYGLDSDFPSDDVTDSTSSGDSLIPCGDLRSLEGKSNSDVGTREEIASNAATEILEEAATSKEENEVLVTLSGMIERVAIEANVDEIAIADNSYAESSVLHITRVENPECKSDPLQDEHEATFGQAVFVRNVSKALIDSIEHDAVAKVSADSLSYAASAAQQAIKGRMEAAFADTPEELVVQEVTECVVAVVEDAERVSIAREVAEEDQEMPNAVCVGSPESDDITRTESHEESLTLQPAPAPERTVERMTKADEFGLSVEKEPQDVNNGTEHSVPEDVVVNVEEAERKGIEREGVATEHTLYPVDRLENGSREDDELWIGLAPLQDSIDPTDARESTKNIAHNAAVAQMMATSLVVATTAQVVGTIAAKSILEARSLARADASASNNGRIDVVQVATGNVMVARDAADCEMNTVVCESGVSAAIEIQEGENGADGRKTRAEAPDCSQIEESGALEQNSHEPFCLDDLVTRSDGDEADEHQVRSKEGDCPALQSSTDSDNNPTERDSFVSPDPPSSSSEGPNIEPSRDAEVEVEAAVHAASEGAVSSVVVAAELLGQSIGDVLTTVDPVDLPNGSSVSALVKNSAECVAQVPDEANVDVRPASPNQVFAVAFVADVEEVSIGRASRKEQQNRGDDTKNVDDREVIHGFAERAANQICDDCVAAATTSLTSTPGLSATEPPFSGEVEQNKWVTEKTAQSESARELSASNESCNTSADSGSHTPPEDDSALVSIVSELSSPHCIEPQDIPCQTEAIMVDGGIPIQDAPRDNQDTAEFGDDMKSPTQLPTMESSSPRIDDPALVVTAHEPDIGDALEEEISVSETTSIRGPESDEFDGNVIPEVSDPMLPAGEPVESIERAQPSDQSETGDEEIQQRSSVVEVETRSPSVFGAVGACIEKITSAIEAEADGPTHCDASNDEIFELTAEPSTEGDIPEIARSDSDVHERSGIAPDAATVLETTSCDASTDASPQPEQLNGSVVWAPSPDLVRKIRGSDEGQPEEPREHVLPEPVSIPESGETRPSSASEPTGELLSERRECHKASEPRETILQEPQGETRACACEEVGEAHQSDQPNNSREPELPTEPEVCEPQESDSTHHLVQSRESALSKTIVEVEKNDMGSTSIASSSDVSESIVQPMVTANVETRARPPNSEHDSNTTPATPQLANDKTPVDIQCMPTFEEMVSVLVVANHEPAKTIREYSEANIAPVEASSDIRDDRMSPGDSDPAAITKPASTPTIASTPPPGFERIPLVIAAVEAGDTNVVWSPSKTDTWQDLVSGSTFTPLEMSMGRSNSPVVKAGHQDSSRYQSAIVQEQIRDPTLMAYGVKQEQATPFAMLDDKILMIDQNARHMQYDENDNVRRAGSESQVNSGRVNAIEGILVTKRKKMENEAHRKSIAYRIIPAFNYEPVLIKFQWSDFVVATPICLMSSASQINVLTSLNGSSDTAKTADASSDKTNKTSKPQILTSPIQKMKLILKKGVKLPCGTYVIISVFNRPLEDGNENLRIQIYDAENVEEFQYDFHEDHLRDYVDEWKGVDEEAIEFYERLVFRREQGSIIIKMPGKIRQSPSATPDTNSKSSDGLIRVFTPPPMAQLLTNLATTQPLELPPEPHYRLSPNAPASPPRLPPPFLHQTTAPDRLESISFISKIDEDNESMGSTISRR